MRIICIRLLILLLALAGCGCERVLTSMDFRALFRGKEEVPDELLAQRREWRRWTAAGSTFVPARRTTGRRPSLDGYEIDLESGRTYLAMARNSGAPAFVKLNGRTVVYSTSPVDDPGLRLTSRIEVGGQMHYTYREVY